ncbi:MAG: DNA polymerase III subunit alpha [Kyrpidia tusciae]|nr:DNA polymerase III subunit alpha [Kyrpidia tusciae]MBE3552065.1 DNA polymerase III subunit alpha [Kyrpidia tusciae]
MVHLHAHSYFSFLHGVSSPMELAETAAKAGVPALALTDRDTVAGLVPFHRAAERVGIRPISGSEITMEDGTVLTVLAENAKGYAELCTLLTKAHLSHPRGEPRTLYQDLVEHREGLIVLSGDRRGRIPTLLLQKQNQKAREMAEWLRDGLGKDRFFLEIQDSFTPGSQHLTGRLCELADTLDIGVTATHDIHYASPDQFPIYDVLTCIRNQTGLESPHPERPLNGKAYLLSPEEMTLRFKRRPDALHRAMEIAERCQVSLDLSLPRHPAFPHGPGDTPMAILRRLTEEGAIRRYGSLTPEIRRRLEHELAIIETLGYADYFLVVWDVVQYARKKGIRYAGRGSAADSAVAYCLGITDVDAAGRGLLFERFISLERGEKPDIDVDFDARRRDEVAAYVYNRYGEDHVAAVCTYQTFQIRSAIREVGRVMGFPPPLLDRLAKRIPYMVRAGELGAALERFPELRDAGIEQKQVWQLFHLVSALVDIPRHIGTHLGGLVISREPLTTVTSLQRSAKGVIITPFDKRAVEDVGLMKLDLLSLRTLSAVEDTVQLLHRDGKPIDPEDIPLDDPDTFAAIGEGRTIGVFQLESPAQRALQVRLKPDHLEDLVASVALIRPGPIKGNMVEPFLERRRGNAEFHYIHPALKPILDKTYGVILFQEQVIEIVTAVAGFTPGEADRLRRVMSHHRSLREMEEIGELFLEKSMARGVSRETAEQIYNYIKGYASYGFCEAHAAAFAATAYRTAYLARHYPAAYYAGLLNQFPMGYYPIHVLCSEARRRGVEILPPDVNNSETGCRLEKGNIRLGLNLIKGLPREEVARIIEDRERHGPFASPEEFCLRIHPSRTLLENLILTGAFDRLYPNRRQLLWYLNDLLQLSGVDIHWTQILPPPGDSGDFTLKERLFHEYRLIQVGLSGHLMELFRPVLRTRRFLPVVDLESFEGKEVWTAGILVRPHRPPTPSGKTVVFFSLEDETGMVDAVMFEKEYRRSGGDLFRPDAIALGVHGTVERRRGHLQLVVDRVRALT